LKKLSIDLLSIVLITSSSFALSSGPADGLTGAPGEGTCVQCHNSFPLNSGTGLLSIDFPAGEEFEPGQTYEMTVSLENSGQSRWGFELTDLGEGTLSVSDNLNTQLSSNGPYLKHTSAGTFNGTTDGPVSWTFSWTAAQNAPDEVTFYAAGNAANGSGTTGDYIYSTSLTLFNAEVGVEFAEVPVDFAVLQNYPNPFNPSTEIVFNLSQTGNAKLEIYNLQGQLLEVLADNTFSAGEHRISWNAEQNGRHLSSSMYLSVLTTPQGIVSNRMLLLR
jgi:hypothetical protein